MKDILLNPLVITRPSIIAGMIWISDLGAVDLGRDSADHYKLVALMMSLMSRYVLDR
jgi:hypothetical protein